MTTNYTRIWNYIAPPPRIKKLSTPLQHIARSKAKLVDNAIPCILPGCPSYLSTSISKPTRLS